MVEFRQMFCSHECFAIGKQVDYWHCSYGILEGYESIGSARYGHLVTSDGTGRDVCGIAAAASASPPLHAIDAIGDQTSRLWKGPVKGAPEHVLDAANASDKDHDAMTIISLLAMFRSTTEKRTRVRRRCCFGNVGI